MEKILIAIDSHCLDINTVRFACHLATLTSSKLTAVFLEDQPSECVVVQSTEALSGQGLLTIIRSEDSRLPARREKNILLFKQLTQEAGIHSTVYLDKGVPAEELVRESLFADVLVVDAATFAGASDDPPTGFIKHILHDAVCPVIIAPETFDGIDNIVFCYDGGRSSLFAIKQFAYLFPQLCQQRIKVIDIKEGATSSMEEARITGWLKTHFSDVEWIAQGPEASAALFTFLLEKADDLVVMGAYGKGLLSSFFEADPQLGITRTTTMPIFIAHL